MAGENVYQMWLRTRAEGERLFLRRDSWATGTAEVVFVPELTGEAPYFRSGPPDYYSPPVLMLVSYRRGQPVELAELTSPNTYAYAQIEQPDWWDTNKTVRKWTRAFGQVPNE